MKTTQHTPKGHLPLMTYGSGNYRHFVGIKDVNHKSVADVSIGDEKETAEFAQFIVTACNAHYELLQACKAALPYVDACVVHQCDGAIEANKQIRMALQLAEQTGDFFTKQAKILSATPLPPILTKLP